MSRNLKLFIILLGVFIFGTLIGWIVGLLDPNLAEHAYMVLRKLLGGNNLPEGFELFILIFLNNVRVATIIAFGGIILGIVPFLVLLFNGIVVGIVISYTASRGVPGSKILLSIIPHGIVEIPAFIIAGIGGINWFLEVVKGEGELENRFKRGFKIMLRFLILAISLLFIAALIEAFITPKLAGIS